MFLDPDTTRWDGEDEDESPQEISGESEDNDEVTLDDDLYGPQGDDDD